MAEATLVLVCKRPGLGMGKQRLAANIGQEAANHVAEALLACALEDARDWAGPVVNCAGAPSDFGWADALLAAVAAEGCIYCPQATGNLGQRLNILDHALRGGDWNNWSILAVMRLHSRQSTMQQLMMPCYTMIQC